MKNKTRMWFSMLMNAAAFLFTCAAVGAYFLPGATDSLGNRAFQCFRYFTTDSNIVAGMAALIFLICELRAVLRPGKTIPRWAFVFKYAATLLVTVTFLTVVFFLAPTTALKGGKFNLAGYFRLFEGNALTLHLLTPVIMLISLLCFEGTGCITKKDALYAVLPVILYSGVYALCVLLLSCWPDFYGFTFGGKMYMAPVSAFVMYLAAWGLAALIRVVGRKDCL